jgi:hypothetical protein
MKVCAESRGEGLQAKSITQGFPDWVEKWLRDQLE